MYNIQYTWQEKNTWAPSLARAPLHTKRRMYSEATHPMIPPLTAYLLHNCCQFDCDIGNFVVYMSTRMYGCRLKYVADGAEPVFLKKNYLFDPAKILSWSCNWKVFKFFFFLCGKSYFLACHKIITRVLYTLSTLNFQSSLIYRSLYTY